jgi:hypothetical protein
MAGSDERIDLLASQSYDNEGAAFAALSEAVSIVNGEMEAAHVRGTTTEAFAGDVGQNLRKWIARLTEMVKAIVRQFNAMSYTIGVSWPAGVSVSITWTRVPATQPT